MRATRQAGSEEGSDIAMLNVVSFSSWALVTLLGRWSSCSPRKGGLKDDEARISSADFLQALCLLVSRQGHAFVLTIDLSLDWAVKWPRPMEVKQPATMLVDAFGRASFGKWVADVESQHRSPTNHWFHSRVFAQLASALGPEPRLADLFAQSMQEKVLSLLFRQLLWHIGTAVQQTLQSVMTPKSRQIVVRVPGLGDALSAGAEQWDVQLLRYNRAAQQAAKHQNNFSLCTDKAAVCGLGGGVQNVIFGLLPNLGIIGIPQVGDGSGPETDVVSGSAYDRDARIRMGRGSVMRELLESYYVTSLFGF